MIPPWAPGGPQIDNEAGTAYFGGVALIPGSEQDQQLGPNPVALGAPILLGAVRFRTVGEGATQLSSSRLRLIGVAAETPYQGSVTTGQVSVGAGPCAARLPSPTPWAPSPTATPPPIPVPAPVYPLPPGLPAAEEGCVWWVINPEPPKVFIAKYCGADQTVWLYDLSTGDLRLLGKLEFMHDDSFNCAPTWGTLRVERDPRCPELAVPTPPPAASGCRWVSRLLSEGDASPFPPPSWDILVEVCADRETGRAFDPINGRIMSVTPRQIPDGTSDAH